MNRVFTLFFAAFITLAAAPSHAAVYEIEPSHTRVFYHLNHLGLSNYYGHFNAIKGTIDFDPENVGSASTDITIDAKSVSMDHQVMDAKLRGKEYFNTDKFPTITFKSTSVEKTDANTGTIDGKLTLLGVTKPVTLDVRFNNKIYNPHLRAMMVGFSATTKIRRSDFGMKGGLPQVGDEVTLIIEVEAFDKAAKIETPAQKPVDKKAATPAKK